MEATRESPGVRWTLLPSSPSEILQIDQKSAARLEFLEFYGLPQKCEPVGTPSLFDKGWRDHLGENSI